MSQPSPSPSPSPSCLGRGRGGESRQADACLPQILDVVSSDMCIACGACVIACPTQSVVPSYNDGRGAHEVAVPNLDFCSDCERPCETVCPSLNVNLMELLAPISSGASEVPREGPVESIQIGYSPRHRDNGISSSGGVIRLLIEHFLQQGFPVICLGREGGGYEAIRIDAVEDLARIPGSIYHSVSYVKCLGLLKSLRSPCLLIATPCQFEGILKYIRTCDPDIEKNIALKLGLICGWMYSDHSLRAFGQFKKIAGPIVDAGYRGEDKVGLLKIRTSESEHKFKRVGFGSFKDQLDYQSSFSRPINRLRCRVCENHVNVLADIAVGDAWLRRKEGEKLSVIVARTEAGQRKVSELIESGDLRVDVGDAEDIIESQSANLVYGYVARKLSTYLQKSKVTTPRFVFSNDDVSSGITISDRLRFRYEFFLRRLVRKKRYATYRRFYICRVLLVNVIKFFIPRIDVLLRKRKRPNR